MGSDSEDDRQELACIQECQKQRAEQHRLKQERREKEEEDRKCKEAEAEAAQKAAAEVAKKAAAEAAKKAAMKVAEEVERVWLQAEVEAKRVAEEKQRESEKAAAKAALDKGKGWEEPKESAGVGGLTEKVVTPQVSFLFYFIFLCTHADI